MKVYPRVCGGTDRFGPVFTPEQGLSPRVRGNPITSIGGGGTVRSIPACAGEPPLTAALTESQWVYPRVCGGTAAALTPYLNDRGLSPRVRGNLAGISWWLRIPRSIPACAGEPTRPFSGVPPVPVYPRVCGGTSDGGQGVGGGGGLSPRVRGNRGHAAPPVDESRSIPACAGEPWR